MLRKITIENSLEYTAQNEQTRERDNKPSTTKNISLPKKQNKKLSQNNKKLIKEYRYVD